MDKLVAMESAVGGSPAPAAAEEVDPDEAEIVAK
eukprot:SAG22_NODE_230_length_14595_cov_50.767660_12_plen_34_part_00